MPRSITATGAIDHDLGDVGTFAATARGRRRAATLACDIRASDGLSRGPMSLVRRNPRVPPSNQQRRTTTGAPESAAIGLQSTRGRGAAPSRATFGRRMVYRASQCHSAGSLWRRGRLTWPHCSRAAEYASHNDWSFGASARYGTGRRPRRLYASHNDWSFGASARYGTGRRASRIRPTQ
jgi:hypothetical protein